MRHPYSSSLQCEGSPSRGRGGGSHWLSQCAAFEVPIKEPLQSSCVRLYSDSSLVWDSCLTVLSFFIHSNSTCQIFSPIQTAVLDPTNLMICVVNLGNPARCFLFSTQIPFSRLHWHSSHSTQCSCSRAGRRPPEEPGPRQPGKTAK